MRPTKRPWTCAKRCDTALCVLLAVAARLARGPEQGSCGVMCVFLPRQWCLPREHMPVWGAAAAAGACRVRAAALWRLLATSHNKKLPCSCQDIRPKQRRHKLQHKTAVLGNTEHDSGQLAQGRAVCRDSPEAWF